MTLSDTIRRAALGPKPVKRAIMTGWLFAPPGHTFDRVLDMLWDDEFCDWAKAPEEVQRMFLCFVAESCE